MTDFRINVIIDPKGATQGGKAVERQLGRVETSANRVQTALKRAFAFLTVGFAIKEIVNFADSLTDLQNRLRLLVPEQQQLVKTTRDLLGVANQTRTAFEGTVILYQRLGLATRELGVDSGDLLGIVKSINQALILSGASAKEANNGLIQLSQGIAANRLGGDELRSTLEQLPAVADVIAKELGITRGELRELGAEGKITGEIIIEAFRNAKDELEQNFAKTIPTLSQSFTVLRNNLTVFFGELNEGTGLLRGLGAAIRFVGNNIDALVRSLVVLGTTFGALRLAPTVQAFFELQAAAKAGRVVILGSAEAARQKAIFDRDQAAAAVTAAGAEVRLTQAAIASTKARVAARAEAVKSLAAEKAKIDIQVLGAQANLQAAQAGLAQAEVERANIPLSGTVADVRARVAIADANVAASRRGVLVATDQATAAEARLAAATKAVQGATLAAQRAENNLALAHKAAASAATDQAAAEARLASATAAANAQANIFTRSLAKVRAGVRALTAAIAANPIGALFVALTAIITTLFVFRDRIRLAGDSIATLGDFVTAFVNQASAAFTFLLQVIDDTFGPALDVVQDFLGGLTLDFRTAIEFIAAIFDTLIGIVAGVVAFIGSIILDIPDIFDRSFRIAVNFAASALEFLPRTILAIVKTGAGILSTFIGGVSKSVSLFGQSLDALFSRDFGRAKDLAVQAAGAIGSAFEDATSDIGGKFKENFDDNFFNDIIPRLEEPAGRTFAEIGDTAALAFSEAFNANPVLGFVGGLFADAELIAQSREAEERRAKEVEQRQQIAAAAAEQAEAVGKLLGQLQNEQTVLTTALQQGQLQADIQREILNLNQQLAEAGLSGVSAEQEEEITALITRNDQLSRFLELQRELIPVGQELVEKEALIREAFAQGFLTLEQYEQGLRNVKLEQAELGTTVSDGLVTGMQKVSESLNDVASLAESAFVNAFSAAEDALVAFATGGSVTFRDFASGILKDIARLVSRLLLLQALQAASGLGGPVGSFFGDLANVGAAADGSTMAMANKPFIVGEEGPELFTPGQTGSITPTDQTIGALAAAGSAQGQTTVVQAPAPEVNVQVVNVDSPDAARSAMDTSEGGQIILNQIRKNRSLIQKELGTLG